MLKRLHIRNYALIETLEIDFSNQLTIITGETGAGKSILLGALGLIMGERAENKIFYNENEKCVVEGYFDVSAYDLTEFFESHELDYDTEVVVRRELSPAGKSRSFVNDTPVTSNVLKRLTDSLIDLHLQFDTLDIHNVNFQLRMIDALADNQITLKIYQNGFKQYLLDRKKLTEMQTRSENASKEMDFLNFQLAEFQKASLVQGEQETLEEDLSRLTNAEDIKRTYGTAYNVLSDNEQNIINQLQELSRSMNSTRRFTPELGEISERLEATLIELQELAKDCERIADSTEHDGQRIMEAQERLNVIYKLQKKHAVNSVTDLLSLQDSLEQQLGGFTDLGDEIIDLELKIAEQSKELKSVAAELNKKRIAVTEGFETKVHAMLGQLSMPHARLKVDIKSTDNLTSTGTDEVQFLFASNVGSKFQPIKDVASGGELSRLTLCTKSLVADAIPLPTLIFDEIDTGISGDVSLKMGIILKELSSRHQVVSITHTPQIAARADKHYFVYKKVENDRTLTNVRLLSPDERVRNIAVMLSGNPPSDAAMETARELLR
jgi:DNA repair protein RecN (Recombination protein N)